VDLEEEAKEEAIHKVLKNQLMSIKSVSFPTPVVIKLLLKLQT